METSSAVPATASSYAVRRTFAATLVVLAAAFLLALFAAQPAHAADAKGDWHQCTWEIKGDTFTVTASSGGNAIKNSSESIPWKRSADKADMTGVKRIVIGTKENPVKLEGNSANRLFDGLSKVESIDLSHFDATGVEDIGGLFYNCSSLTSLDLSGFDTSQVTSVSNMFNGCGALTFLDLSSFDTSQVTNMDNMFNLCVSLTSLDLSGFDTSKVTSMSEMFYGCKALTSLDLSSFNTSLVKDMGGMFKYCEKLASLNLSTFDTSQVTDKASMFSNTSLSAICLSEKFNDFPTLPNNTEKAIADTGLTTTGKWIDPDGSVCDRYSLNPSTKSAGWYLAQPKSGSYALFDWDVPAAAPVFVPASGGTAAPPASLNERAPSNWLDEKGTNVGFEPQAVTSGSAAAFSATWEQLPVTASQFDVTLPKDVAYNGSAQKALVKPKDIFVGKVTEVRYSKDGAPATTEPPKDAGTYQVSLVCEAGAGYHASVDPIPCGEFTIEQRVLSNKVKSSVVIQVFQGEPYKSESVAIQLSGANIVRGALDAVATDLVFPDNKTPGDHYDGSLRVVEVKDANYAVPEGGIPIKNQQYRVDPKNVPSIDDFQVILPQNPSYDGNAHEAEVASKEGVKDIGTVTVYYTKTDGEPSDRTTTAPADAGTYKVELAVAEGYAYTEATIDAGRFTIAPITLNEGETADLPSVVAGSTTDPVAVDSIQLTGGAILAGESLTVTAMVTHPTTDTVADYTNATVTNVVLKPANANYVVPEGYQLTCQVYQVSAKPVPTIADFEVSAVEAEYDGEAHEAGIAAKTEGVGEAQNVRYLKSGAPVSGSPVGAGAYTLVFDVPETASHAAAANLVAPNAVTIAPCVLDTSTSVALDSIDQGTFTASQVNVKLTGGRIIGGAELEAIASEVSYLSGGKPGDHADASVLLASLVNAPNYSLPEGGLVLEGQVYTVNGKAPNYAVVEGANATWQEGSEGGLRVTANADFAKFRSASVDGVPVDPENYTAESGSTVVTLRPAYLATLTPGQHTLRLIFDDGAAETTFTVAEAPGPDPEPDDPQPKPLPSPGEQPGGSSGSGSATLAPTGDGSAAGATALAVLALAAAAALALARRKAR